MAVQYVSPTITWQEWQTGAKTDVDVFEDQLRGWLFEQARALSSGSQAGPAILMLITPYYEALACYLEGQSSRGQESAFLRKGIAHVFPAVPVDAVNAYVLEARHGFAHEAIFRRLILHRAQGLPGFRMDATGTLCIDPWFMLEVTEAQFNEYVGMLRANRAAHLLANFSAFMAVRKTR